MKQILERMQAPTPKFYKRIRNVGYVCTAISVVISTATVELPIMLVKMAGYVGIAGGIASAICQTTVEKETK